jgi:hypothetical protein
VIPAPCSSRYRQMRSNPSVNRTCNGKPLQVRLGRTCVPGSSIALSQSGLISPRDAQLFHRTDSYRQAGVCRSCQTLAALRNRSVPRNANKRS